tara:strand:- start:124579 stop:125277 length:699 start_codon:yes stop_codon:yes gene_type:complete
VQYRLAIFSLLFSAFSVWAQMPIQPLKTEKHVSQALLKIHQAAPHSAFCQEPIDQLGNFVSQETPSFVKKPSVIWYPVVSKKMLAQHRPCYQEAICVDKNHQRFKGLRCCKQLDNLYNIMLHDLHNRLPIHPKLQKILNQTHYDTVQDKYHCETFYGLFYDKKQKILEVPNRLKGEIARINLYMADAYSLPMSQSTRLLYTQWHQAFPPSKWELEKNSLVAEIQGNRNPFVG